MATKSKGKKKKKVIQRKRRKENLRSIFLIKYPVYYRNLKIFKKYIKILLNGKIPVNTLFISLYNILGIFSFL